MVLLAVGMILSGLMSDGLPFLILFLVALCIGFTPRFAEYRPRRLRASDLRLLEDPDDPDVCLVEMEVFVGHESVGHDRGVAWFAEGRLLYSGHRTSFALGGEDVMPEVCWYEFSAEGRFLPDWAVPLHLPKGLAYVSLVPINRGGGPLSRQETRFLERLTDFRKGRTRSTGPRQWPPLEA